MLNRLIFGSVHTLLTVSGECYLTRCRQIAADGIYVVRVEDRRLGYSHENPGSISSNWYSLYFIS